MLKYNKHLSYPNVITVAIYFGLITVIVVAFSRAANWAETNYQSEEAFEDWEEWRAEAKEQSQGKGPVKRRIPKSAAPPALILAKEHYYSFLTITIVLSTALYATFAFFVRGVLLPSGERGT